LFRAINGEYKEVTYLFGVQNLFYVETIGVVPAIEHSQLAGYRCVWLESNFIFLCKAFSSIQIVPW